jgi:hypothetical protein
VLPVPSLSVAVSTSARNEDHPALSACGAPSARRGSFKKHMAQKPKSEL